MAWTKRIKYTRPNTDVAFYKADDAASGHDLDEDDLSYMATNFTTSGKIASVSTSLSDNQLELTKTIVYKDEASKDEHASDSKARTFRVAMDEYNTSNNISQAKLQDEAT